MNPVYNELAVTRHGVMLANKNDMFVGRSLLQYGEFSKGEAELFAQIIPPRGLVVEVGANIGALTVPIARRAQYVVAIEPQRIAFQTLCANVQLNSLINVWTLHAACGAETGEVCVPDLDPRCEQNFGGQRMSDLGPPTNAVPLLRLDDVLARWEMPLVFLKMDVEGMERDVMRGAERTIRRDRPILFYENDRPETFGENVQWVEATFGYRVFQHLAPLYVADNFRHNPDNVFANIQSGNCIGVPAESPLVELLTTAATTTEIAA